MRSREPRAGSLTSTSSRSGSACNTFPATLGDRSRASACPAGASATDRSTPIVPGQGKLVSAVWAIEYLGVSCYPNTGTRQRAYGVDESQILRLTAHRVGIFRCPHHDAKTGGAVSPQFEISSRDHDDPGVEIQDDFAIAVVFHHWIPGAPPEAVSTRRPDTGPSNWFLVHRSPLVVAAGCLTQVRQLGVPKL